MRPWPPWPATSLSFLRVSASGATLMARYSTGFNRAVLDIAQPAAGAATPERCPLRTPWFPLVDVLLRLNVPRCRRKARLKPDSGAVRAANVATDDELCSGVNRLWHGNRTAVALRRPTPTANQPLAAAPADGHLHSGLTPLCCPSPPGLNLFCFCPPIAFGDRRAIKFLGRHGRPKGLSGRTACPTSSVQCLRCPAKISLAAP